MRLVSTQELGLDISSPALVMTYTNDRGKALLVISHLELGSALNPIAGGATYNVSVRIDGVPVSPDSSVIVTAGRTRTVLQSRIVTLSDGETITIYVTGAPSDLSVDVEAVLDDTTPATLEELVGEGSVPVDHNYGGTDELRIISSPDVGVLDATISAYLKSDYDAGNRSHHYVKGRTTTNINGRWRNPLSLSPGTYVLVIAKPQVIVTKTQELEVVGA